jgi:hypothetical protein
MVFLMAFESSRPILLPRTAHADDEYTVMANFSSPSCLVLKSIVAVNSNLLDRLHCYNLKN